MSEAILNSPISRRTLFAGAIGGGAALALASWPKAFAASAPFVHGVASGDPLPNAVILWTRVTPTVEATPGSGLGPDVAVTWQVSKNAAFTQIVAQGTAVASAASDHTLHVDAGGLAPATAYYYRFQALGATSRVGRTKTAPAATSDAAVRFGVVSCANYDWGWFVPYRYLATRTDLDAVLHLGDYVYEYAPGGVIAGFPKNPRNADPLHECTTLSDYRVRHGCYKLEQNLQDLHAAHPMVAVWDDHEIANDTWMEGAENHDPAVEGDWATRATAGRKAFLEWLPIRHTDPDDWAKINRRLAFGKQVDLWMLDERRFRTQPPKSLLLGYGAFGSASSDPNASMIGADQEHWLVEGLATSTARWKVLGNQVPFFPQNLGPQVPGQISALLGPELSEQLEEPLLQLYVEDWNGFLKQRQRIVDGMAGISDVVVLTGDVHQSFASEIPVRPSKYLLDRKSAAVEYVTPGVASPSVQTMINQVAPGTGTALDVILATNNLLSNPWIKYSQGIKTGCMIVEFGSSRMQADWFLVDKGTDPNSGIRWTASRQTVSGSRRVTAAKSPLAT